MKTNTIQDQSCPVNISLIVVDAYEKFKPPANFRVMERRPIAAGIVVTIPQYLPDEKVVYLRTKSPWVSLVSSFS